MSNSELKLTEQSIKTELDIYKGKPYKCLFEYIWNSFDAKATEVKLSFTPPSKGFGYVQDVKIIDNGEGWDFKSENNTQTFLSSSKKDLNTKYKTLPKGKYGRGRYTFIWIAEKLEIKSSNRKLSLDHSTKLTEEVIKEDVKGTEIDFIVIDEKLSKALSDSKQLETELLLEFGWFLAGNKALKVFINDKHIDISKIIEKREKLRRKDFKNSKEKELVEKFEIEIILWKQKPSEYSKYYFLSKEYLEIYKENTGLNKQGDDFWHSVYIASDHFSKGIEDENGQQYDLFTDEDSKKLKRSIIELTKEYLIQMRKPYLLKQSDVVLETLKEEKLLPDLPEYGIFDNTSYDDLIKTIYTITPSLFVGKSSHEKKFICATFAGLLSTQDKTLIQTLLEQLYELTESEKEDLLNILNRTSLSNIVSTIKEIDHRLEVIDKLEVLHSEHKQETLEVKHIQKILDDNFWVFGEGFRLFSSTEGALKKVLNKYAKEILEIEDPLLDTQPRGEVDLFLTKTEPVNDKVQKNIIVELKRASIKLTESKEYKQINDYRKKILEQGICNSDNQYWEFYLIGIDYNQEIKDLIENAEQHGEKDRGLVLNINEGRVKIYIRKWSDILEVEWGSKMKYLKEKLKIEATVSEKTPDKIVGEL